MRDLSEPSANHIVRTLFESDSNCVTMMDTMWSMYCAFVFISLYLSETYYIVIATCEIICLGCASRYSGWRCINYLLLCGKFPPNFIVYHNKHVSSHSYQGWEIQEWLCWVILAQVSHKVSLRLLAEGCRHTKACLGWKIFWAHSCDCWQESSAPWQQWVGSFSFSLHGHLHRTVPYKEVGFP